LRLWPDTLREVFREEPRLADASHYAQKTRVGIDHVCLAQGEVPISIGGVYVLSSTEDSTDSSGVSVDPLSPREAFLELTKYLYRLHVNDRRRLKVEFSKLGRIANEIPFSRLRYPRRFSSLPSVREAVLNHLSEAR
jgi:hypothetical protein